MPDVVVVEVVDEVTGPFSGPVTEALTTTRTDEILHIEMSTDTPVEIVSVVEEVVQVTVEPTAVVSMSIVEEITSVNTFGTGPPGLAGEAATITVGTTTTGPPGADAEVTNAGTETHAVLDFVIPRGSSAGTHHHVQPAPSAVWTINHNLGYRPSVNVQDSGGNQWFGDVTYLDDNTLTVTFAYPFGGTADLS